MQSNITYERSCGAIVFHEVDGELRVLLVKHRPGHWSFPKGHVEAGETDIETAIREVAEETGIQIDIASDFQRQSTYSPKPGVIKTVVFFLGDYIDGELTPQLEEVSEVRWMAPEEGMPYLVFDRDREIFIDALAYRHALKQGGKACNDVKANPTP
ncbi:MAG: bis(5'-nucleosyl)-tetraphosphatase [Saccharofermentanales bacterium]|jgi:bis(5'-nucleosidyl)-tetraphosphatase